MLPRLSWAMLPIQRLTPSAGASVACCQMTGWSPGRRISYQRTPAMPGRASTRRVGPRGTPVSGCRTRRRAAGGCWSFAASLEVDHGRQPQHGGAVERVVGPHATLLAVEQPGLDELGEVVADGRLGQSQGVVEVAGADRLGAVGELVDDADPVGVAERLEQRGGRLGLLGCEGRGGQRDAARRRRGRARRRRRGGGAHEITLFHEIESTRSKNFDEEGSGLIEVRQSVASARRSGSRSVRAGSPPGWRWRQRWSSGMAISVTWLRTGKKPTGLAWPVSRLIWKKAARPPSCRVA